MKRRFKILSRIINCLLVVATASLWWASHYYDEDFSYTTRSGARFSAAGSYGCLTFGWEDISTDPTPFTASADYSFISNDPGAAPVFFIYTCQSPAADLEPVINRIFGTSTSSWHGLTLTRTRRLLPSTIPSTAEFHMLFGPWRAGQVRFPFWMLELLLAFPLTMAVTRIIWKRRPRNPFACPNCNYDLRATPARCPECGLAKTQLSPAASSAAALLNLHAPV